MTVITRKRKVIYSLAYAFRSEKWILCKILAYMHSYYYIFQSVHVVSLCWMKFHSGAPRLIEFLAMKRRWAWSARSWRIDSPTPVLPYGKPVCRELVKSYTSSRLGSVTGIIMTGGVLEQKEITYLPNLYIKISKKRRRSWSQQQCCRRRIKNQWRLFDLKAIKERPCQPRKANGRKSIKGSRESLWIRTKPFYLGSGLDYVISNTNINQYYTRQPNHVAFHDLTEGRVVPPIVKQVLGLSHKFIPIQGYSISSDDIELRLVKFEQDAHLKTFFAGSPLDNDPEPLYMNWSNTNRWTPRAGKMPTPLHPTHEKNIEA